MMATTVKKSYLVQCSRCDGRGRYDRGTCFGCKGSGVKKVATKPRKTAFNLYKLEAQLINAETFNDLPDLYATTSAIAISIVERAIRVSKAPGYLAGSVRVKIV